MNYIVTSLGLGAATANTTTLLSKYVPEKKRSVLLAVMFTGFNFGSALIGFVAVFMPPQFGWHSVLVFGASARPISASNSITRHALEASGSIGTVATILALQNNEMPLTTNYLGTYPECDLDYVPNVARPARLRSALSNSFALGGLNATLVFTKEHNPSDRE